MAFREFANDGILAVDVLAGIGTAVIVEDYPIGRIEPSVLVLQRERTGRLVHVMWGVPKLSERRAILVTAYRPDPRRWSIDFKTRKKE